MLNFRRLKRDLPPAILKEGRELYEKGMVASAKILYFDNSSLRISGRVRGSFDNLYEIEVEIDRNGSEMVDSNCDCSYRFDCQHLAALLFYLEEHLDKILVQYSEEADLESYPEIDAEKREEIKETLEAALTKEEVRKGQQCQQELLGEYVSAARVLGLSPFFLPKEKEEIATAELAVIYTLPLKPKRGASVDLQIALRLPLRSKPLHIPDLVQFLGAVRYSEPIWISGRRYLFSIDSFDRVSATILETIIAQATFLKEGDERQARVAQLELSRFGSILAEVYNAVMGEMAEAHIPLQERQQPRMPCLYHGSLEQPLLSSLIPAKLRFELQSLSAPAPRLFLKPMLVIGEKQVEVEEALLLESPKPGVVHEGVYSPFPPQVCRVHLRDLAALRNIAIPEPLFGTFVENSLPELSRFAEVGSQELIEEFVTLPYVGELSARCQIEYLNGELEARLFFKYDDIEVPAASSQLTYEQATAYITQEGILARSLTEEQAMMERLFQGFIFNEEAGTFIAKTERKIVEFMTEVVPKNQELVQFDCPENLLEQFIYDETTFSLHLKEGTQVDSYELELKVDGHLQGVATDLLWESISSKKTFLELERRACTSKKGRKTSGVKANKILVLDLEKITPVVQLFDEIGIKEVKNHTLERPLWSLVSIHAAQFEGLPVKLHMSKKLEEIQEQMLGKRKYESSPVPEIIKASLRKYQVDGVEWLERLRSMHLNGILADDMGLGKTLQAIIALTQHYEKNPGAISLVVCPTSLLYNWQEELFKFHPDMKVLVVDGTPTQRKRLISKAKGYGVLITSYSLLQKDIELYEGTHFAYVVLDEAQNIKNRGTRNAKSVKCVNAAHKLILTGTPIENSLDELWSLFDFLMPGLLSSYDRFVEKYIRNSAHSQESNLDQLSKKIAPFILRRMKSDVLSDLPPVSEIVYHCHLSPVQRELYRSYARSAREELTRLVKKEGFDKVQIHVLATLTRLKQICCHPAIFAKEQPEPGDSAKYDMLLELLPSLVEGGHKTVIFSQYTRMLGIMRTDLEQLGIRFAYLDGSSKNRLEIVKQFNDDPSILVFLVSLKAGGSGLNLVGADTVIHYDMWWNPAVENQATDRVHRMGQMRSVSAYKLVTLGTIEEKILQLQDRKRGLVKKVVSCDDEAVAKLTWEEVLELLQC